MHKYLIVLFGCLLLLSCKKDRQESVDPLVGNWKLRVVTHGTQSVDVSNRDCFKDSYVNVDSKNYTLYLSLLNDNGQCSDQTVNAEWLFRDGKYYVISNGVERDAGVKLLDNNETLQMTIDSDNGAYLFSFRK